MKLQRLAELIKQYSPVHFRDICASFSLLSDELEYTKTALSKELMAAQKSNDFSKAREILDIQEELSQKIAIIQKLLSESEMEEAELDAEEAEELEASERPDYSLYDMDDTVAYDIKDTPVTFKRPAAFSYKGKRYNVTKWKAFLAELCSILYKEDPSIIQAMANGVR